MPWARWPAEDLTGGPIDIPSSGGPFRQQYSSLGLPLTRGAWRDQALLDEGRLWKRVSAAFGLQEPSEAASALRDPGSHALQAELVRAELEAAERDPSGALVLELLPTEINTLASLRALGDTLLDGLTGIGSNDFRVSRETALIRAYHAHLVAPLRAQGRRIRALVLPYANTVENILARRALPVDGAETLQRYLAKVSPSTFTVAVGYSQGATAAVLGARGPRRPRALLTLATMGGADLAGASGVRWGQQDGARVLSVCNAHDPALYVHGATWLELLPGLLNFSDPNKPVGGRVGIHSGYFGDDQHPLDAVELPGLDTRGLDAASEAWRRRRFGMDAGTFGYPVAYIRALGRAFWAAEAPARVQRSGAWGVDLREELVEDGQGGRPLDLLRLRRDAEAVAAQALGLSRLA
ncbi:MAG: hypothetical protein H6741_16000 [Alphaproteobacteria bacterium]|nr:hypothetical protein [Alphaproteobacteria bacterium]